MQKTSVYRPDIDGLRAIAVIAVIINHFNKGLLPSGFLGVDIFFVISGFVVTSSLDNKQDQSWKDYLIGFYARRVKRIIPPLIVCVVLTSIVGCLFIYPSLDLLIVSLKTGMSSLLGVSNWYLIRQSTNYFANSSILNLFLQTWSLGVEEQFYLIYPLLIALCGFSKKLSVHGNRNLFLTILSLGSLSFCLSSYLYSHGRQEVAFFLMPTRFWELGIGSIIFSIQKSKYLEQFEFLAGKTRNILSIVATLFVIASLFANKPFPELTLIVLITLSSGIVILLQGVKNPVTNTLSSKHLVQIGKLSYSLYLWHWSVLVISRFTIGITKETIFLQLGLIIGLSLASYNFIEKPFRYSNWSLSKFKTIGFGLLASLLSIILLFNLNNGFLKGKLFTGVIINSSDIGVPMQSIYRKDDSGKTIWSVDKCTNINYKPPKNISFENCTFGNLHTAKNKVLVIGNSVSAAEIDMYLPLMQLNTSITVTSYVAIPPAPTVASLQDNWEDEDKYAKYYWEKIVFPMVNRLDKNDILLMIFESSILSPNIPSGSKEPAILVNGLPSSIQQGQNAVIHFLRNLSSSLKAKGVKVIFQSTTPLMKESECTPESSFHQWFSLGDNQCNFLTRTETIVRKNAMDSMLKQLESETDNFFVLDIFDDICPGDVCRYISSDGHFIYRDFAHLSDWGSKRAAPKLLQTFNRALQSVPSAIPNSKTVPDRNIR